ncbi:unnamed protein product [Triticum turgidum subsp. durum]|uniref:Uncharacterized protein n=1 Tax=Triticum turgidum subsp. durum TaxID=4567 RepID=A0A9R0WUY7_TRITD|nr:unnamed protein product [Triticum turgidum subsp. durum]
MGRLCSTDLPLCLSGPPLSWAGRRLQGSSNTLRLAVLWLSQDRPSQMRAEATLRGVRSLSQRWMSSCWAYN